MAKREEALEIEKFVLGYFNEHEYRIRDFYFEQTGKMLPMYLESYEMKDMFDRFIFWLLFDRGFLQADIKGRVDGTASGAPVELKYNTYGVDEMDCFIIDKGKVDWMNPDGRIVVLYFDFPEKAVYARQFLVKDIKKYGRVSCKGGKKDNESFNESKKEVYYINHKYAEDMHVWRKNGKKS